MTRDSTTSIIPAVVLPDCLVAGTYSTEAVTVDGQRGETAVQVGEADEPGSAWSSDGRRHSSASS